MSKVIVQNGDKEHKVTASDTGSDGVTKQSVFSADEFGQTELHKAAKSGDVAYVQCFLDLVSQLPKTELREFINARDDEGRTALFLSCGIKNNQSVSELLLEHGADPKIPDNKSITPLMLAALHTDDVLVTLLLESGASPNDVGGEYNQTAMHYAACADTVTTNTVDSLRIISILFQHGGAVAFDKFHYSPGDYLGSIDHSFADEFDVMAKKYSATIIGDSD